MNSTCIDFGRSFACGNGSTLGRGDETVQNDPRFCVESVLRIFDGRRDPPVVYDQCAACKAEETFAQRNLFKEDNYDFLPVFGEDRVIAFRRKAVIGEMPYRTVQSMEGHPWGRIDCRIRTGKAAPLADFAAIVSATAQCLPIVARTSWIDPASDVRAEIEYPIKTMNLQHRPPMFQIDTGPVLMPDLSCRRECWADALNLAYVAFSGFDRAAFVIEAPVAVGSSRQVMHYSKIVEFAATNSLWALQDR